MKKRVIFTLYIDVQKSDLDDQPPFPGEEINKNYKAKEQFKKHAEWVCDRQKEYAGLLGADYRLFTSDEGWHSFNKSYKAKWPFLTTYLILNFYKIHLIYQLANEYEEVLYFDLDVVPVTHEDFFDSHDLSKGIAVQKELPRTAKSVSRLKRTSSFKISNRSPEAKYWNAHAMFVEDGIHPVQDVYNTGIVGASKSILDQLDYFGDFDETIELMTELKNDNTMYPEWIAESFGWDNETIMSYKSVMNNVPIHNLDRQWHFIMDKYNYVAFDTKLIHIINKEFEYVRGWYEKNNIQLIQQ